MSVRKNKTLARRIHIFLLAGTITFVASAPVYAIPSNMQLPSGFDSILNNSAYDGKGNIHQTDFTAVNKWNNFSIGADAVVNFTADTHNFNAINFVNSGKVSEIYGQINAKDGNIFLANTAGVQIGGSAKINVGSLYVTNKDLTNIHLNTDASIKDIKDSIAHINTTNTELMSLGGIVTAGSITFDGNRIVIDVDHLYQDTDGTAIDTIKQFTIKTADADNVVLGYTNYDSTNKTYLHTDSTGNRDLNQYKQFKVLDNNQETTVDGYMWVENLLQLQAMETNLSGYYALSNSVDANFSADANYNYSSDTGNGFNPVGDKSNSFTGRFDGLGYNIFDLNIKRNAEDYVGLFGYVDNAIIRNVTLNSGSVTGMANTGAAVGSANKSTIANIINTADVNGVIDIGGIIGNAENSTLSNLINTGTITGTGGYNIGGIAGNIASSSITGKTYNLGSVTGKNTDSYTTYNIGGIIGSADASTIGNKGEDAFPIYNELNITGGYNVGGITGQITGNTAIQNVENFGDVLATGHYNDNYSYHSAYYNGIKTETVYAANAGGIAGSATNSSINNTENNGNVTTAITKNTATGDYYNAGNVGGIIGRAENTDIVTAVSKGNDVAGAHNVGGAVGYLTGNSTVSEALNNGGDITATGARNDNGFVTESVRSTGEEKFNIGNIGGIVGYLYGDSSKIQNSANRGTVHSAYITANNVLDISKAANVGGIVGKIDLSAPSDLENISKTSTDDYLNATVANSYSTGNVQGYTGVGGVAGMMYNGSVARSYNLGNISTTRQVVNTGGSNIDPLNMGGIVGDTTEQTDAHSIIYDVYNTGQIGDENYKFFARHVGGIAGRLSGTVDKAYNTGDIFNYDTAVGGIAGWWYNGTINNAFNTGNITIRTNTELQAGGIAGSALGSKATTLSNAYNLGTIRGFQENNNQNDTGSNISLGGIIGRIYNKQLSISNVYTTGNLYAARGTYPNSYTSIGNGDGNNRDSIEAIVGRGPVSINNAYYIKPEDGKGFADLGTTANVTGINYSNRHNADSYQGLDFSTQTGGNIENNTDDNWRIYNGTTPILNVFLPHSEQFFGNTSQNNMNGINSIQYGTAYNPLLTIINASRDSELNFNWNNLGISGAAGLAVYDNDSLILNGFTTSGANSYLAVQFIVMEF